MVEKDRKKWWFIWLKPVLFYPSPLSSQLELSIDGIYTKRLKVKQFWSKICCSQSSFHSYSSSSADKPHLVLLYCQWKIKTCLCLIDVFVLWLVFIGVVSPFTTGLSQMNHHFFLFFPYQNNYKERLPWHNNFGQSWCQSWCQSLGKKWGQGS